MAPMAVRSLEANTAVGAALAEKNRLMEAAKHYQAALLTKPKLAPA